jgi:urea transport system ATP-binding protein
MLHVRQLESGYGESLVIRGVNLEVGEGQVVCVLGRNGVGKTTLLKTIMGILKTRAGEVEFAGRRMTKEGPHVRARAGMGYVPQGRDIFPQLTVQENLLLGLEAGRAEGGTIPEDIYAMFPSLPSLLKRRGGDLSGGQQQQLAIARALVTRPELLILDEPTEGIQPNIVEDIRAAIRQIKDSGVAVLLVEQNLEFVRQAADYFYMMEKGAIVAEGTIDRLDDADVLQHLTV